CKQWSATLSRKEACRSKPVDRFTNTFVGGVNFVAKFPFCLSRREKHAMLCHPQAIQRNERLVPCDPRHGFGGERNWVDWPPWEADAWGGAVHKTRDCAEQFEKRHILTAQNIALADASVPKRRDVPRRDTVHMHEIQACIDVGGHAARRRFNDHSAGGRRTQIPRADWC